MCNVSPSTTVTTQEGCTFLCVSLHVQPLVVFPMCSFINETPGLQIHRKVTVTNKSVKKNVMITFLAVDMRV